MGNRTSWTRIFGLVVGLATVLAAAGSQGGRALAASIPASERLAVRHATAVTVEGLQARLQQGGTQRVIVQLDLSTVPEAKLPRSQVSAQRERIARAQDRLLARPGLAAARALRRLTTMPVVVLEVDAASLDALAANPEVLSIEEDIAVPQLWCRAIRSLAPMPPGRRGTPGPARPSPSSTPASTRRTRS